MSWTGSRIVFGTTDRDHGGGRHGWNRHRVNQWSMQRSRRVRRSAQWATRDGKSPESLPPTREPGKRRRSSLQDLAGGRTACAGRPAGTLAQVARLRPSRLLPREYALRPAIRRTHGVAHRHRRCRWCSVRAMPAFSGAAHFSVADSGTLVFIESSGDDLLTLAWVDRYGEGGRRRGSAEAALFRTSSARPTASWSLRGRGTSRPTSSSGTWVAGSRRTSRKESTRDSAPVWHRQSRVVLRHRRRGFSS